MRALPFLPYVEVLWDPGTIIEPCSELRQNYAE